MANSKEMALAAHLRENSPQRSSSLCGTDFIFPISVAVRHQLKGVPGIQSE